MRKKSFIVFTIVAIAVITVFSSVTLHGQTWQSLGPEGGSMNAIAQDPANDNILYATASGTMTLFKSIDHGENWFTPPQPNLWSSGKIVFDSNEPPNLYVYDSYQINKSTDGGQHWTTTSAPASAYINNIAFNSQNPSFIHAALYCYNSVLAQYELTYGISEDSGTTWTLKKLCTNYSYPYKIVVAKSNPQIIYIGGMEIASSVYKGILLKSSDGGVTFQDRTSSISGYVYDIVIDPSDTNKVYIATSTGVFKTTNGGSTWTPNNGYIPTPNSLCVLEGTTPTVLYCATNSGPYRSIDGGINWTSLITTGLSGTGGVGIIAEKPLGTNLFYANTVGVFKSTNAGASWQSCNGGMIAAQISAIYIPPLAPTTLYASVDNNSLYKTANAASTPVTWQRFDKFFVCTTIGSMVSPPDDPDKLYALEGGG
jgi:hypothetical protein